MDRSVLPIHFFMFVKYSNTKHKSEKDFQVKTHISALWLSEMKYKFRQARQQVSYL